jgi:ethanolamine utilization protein EutN
MNLKFNWLNPPNSPNSQLFMQLARVIGTVVSTVKNQSLDGRKFLIVQTLNADLSAKGKPQIALDAIGAGIGELVFWCRGKEASFPFKRDSTPTDCTIVGIVDSESHIYQKEQPQKSTENTKKNFK